MALTKTTKRNTTTDSGFTKPEIEAAWLLIQLSGDSDDYDEEDHLSSLKSDGDNHHDDEDLHVLIKDLGKRKGQEEEKDREIQEQSSGRSRTSNYNNSDEATSSAMSGTTVSKFMKRNRSDEDEGEDDSEGVAYGMKRRNKKYRSVNELYSQTKPLQIKLLCIA